MRSLKNKMAAGVRIVVIVSAILLGPAIFTYAANTDEFGIISFSPGTTISSSQVNNNFQALINAMPRGVPNLSSGNATLSSSPQTISSLTVTPLMDGFFLLIASAQVRIHLGFDPEPGQGGSGTAKLCITQTPNECGSSAVITLNGPSSYPIANSISIPVTFIGAGPCNANTPVTYYLTAVQLEPSAVGCCSVEGANLSAIFLPGLLQN